MNFEKTVRRIRNRISFLSTPINDTSLYWKMFIKIFREAMAPGKKLFMYLFDLQIISRKVVRMFPLNITLQVFEYSNITYSLIIISH